MLLTVINGLFYLLGVVALVVAVLAIYWHKRRQLPGPPRVPFLGNLLEFQAGKEYVGDLFNKWHAKYSNPDTMAPFEVQLLNRRCVCISDPRQMSQIMFQRPSKYRRMDPMGEIISGVGDGVFSAEGDKWKRHRKVVHPAFLQTNVDKMTGPVNVISRRLKQIWTDIAGKETPIRALLTAAALDVTTLVSFGFDLDSLNHPESADNQNIAKTFPFIMRRLTAPIPGYWHLYHTQTDKEFFEVLPAIDALLNRIITERQAAIEADEGGDDLLRGMIKAGQSDKTNITASEFSGNMLQFLLAGQDTTSSAITWTMYYLATNPEVYAKAQRCVDKVLKTKDDEVTLKNLKEDLGYLEGCVKEALRLAPPAAFLFLQANQDSVLDDGTNIYTDDAVFVLVHPAQLSPKYFPHPTKFKPERWPCAGGSGKDITVDAFNPFGGGARICPGRRLAISESIVILATLMRSLDWKLAPGQPEPKMKFEFAMVCPVSGYPPSSHIYTGERT